MLGNFRTNAILTKINNLVNSTHAQYSFVLPRAFNLHMKKMHVALYTVKLCTVYVIKLCIILHIAHDIYQEREIQSMLYVQNM